MIAFTAANDGAGLLNRKKARQLFFYQKGSLVKSRLYTSGTGGSYGGVRESEVDEYWENAEWRQTVQYLIAHCEGVASKWRFTNYRNENGRLNRYGVQLFKHKCFGSYEDWECFARTKGMIIISRLTPMKDYCESFIVGAEGLYLDDCYECGEYDEIDAE